MKVKEYFYKFLLQISSFNVVDYFFNTFQFIIYFNLKLCKFYEGDECKKYVLCEKNDKKNLENTGLGNKIQT